MDQRANLRNLERRVAHLERLLLALGGQSGGLMTRPARFFVVRLTADLNPGETATADVMAYSSSEEDEVASGESITVYNRYSRTFHSGADGYAKEWLNWAPPLRYHWLVGDC